MKPAVFFDRDGVLNQDIGYLYRPEDFVWTDGAREAIRLCNERGYYVFVVTNQSGVARGYYEERDVIALHNWMQGELAADGAHIDAFYHCPHHPEGKVPQYKAACTCRKPAPGLILQAARDWPVDLAHSFIIGDNPGDVEAGRAAGIKGYLFAGKNLYTFVQTILNQPEE
ncbi:histidinol-phosphate phosphatase [Lucifera butyrica]|uniref:D,D-heptose 1,7-bisphosphate phosphatase n=1 Tax=Lucifera butyrica TaxID=1351585 RepID=A0A498RGU4_9FIRM|nr:HAD family hydrolase [Lucifera butyrica]VBB09302.1 histidinol-phosphate phosphatase [Lucifera butyrica]